jgi:AcrR family transcriptional regulator
VLRERQLELTRRTIVETVLDLVADGTLDELSVPEVARRSGISLATIYRHFPTKAQLLDAAAAEPQRRALAEASSQPPHPGDDDPLLAFQRTMWTSFASNLPLLRHQVTSKAGRDMRSARTDTSRRRLSEHLAASGVDAASPEGERLTALLLLLTGSLGLVELHDRQGLALDDALEFTGWAVRTLIDATATGPDDEPGTTGRTERSA